jgi:hypothetical protein
MAGKVAPEAPTCGKTIVYVYVVHEQHRHSSTRVCISVLSRTHAGARNTYILSIWGMDKRQSQGTV